MTEVLDELLHMRLSPHAQYNGGTLLLIVSCLMLASWTFVWLRREMAISDIELHEVLKINRTRLLVAWVLAGIAFAAGSIIWLPAFPMLIAVERYELLCSGIPHSNEVWDDCQRLLKNARVRSAWFTAAAPWPANIANLFVFVAAVIAMWHPISSVLGRLSIPIVIVVSVFIYYVGAYSTQFLSHFF